jgi:hypothetical protein
VTAPTPTTGLEGPLVVAVDARDAGGIGGLLGNVNVETDDIGYQVGLYPIVTSQYSSTTLYQVSYYIQWLFF